MLVTRLAIPLAALAAAGCASSLEAQQLAESPGFQAGYGDGCITASEEDKSFSTKRTRDAYAFENDRGYRAGWRQGYLECASKLPSANNGGRVLGDENEY